MSELPNYLRNFHIRRFVHSLLCIVSHVYLEYGMILSLYTLLMRVNKWVAYACNIVMSVTLLQLLFIVPELTVVLYFTCRSCGLFSSIAGLRLLFHVLLSPVTYDILI